MSADLLCVQCGESSTKVTDTRNGRRLGHVIRRRRTCLRCGYKWTTYETSAIPLTRNQAGMLKRVFQSLQSTLGN